MPLTPADLFPPLGLRVRAGGLELRGITDDLLAELCEVAERGIHEAGRMPFYVPWTEAAPGDLARNTAAYHWRARADFSPTEWDLLLAVLVDGRVVGCQGLMSHNFLVTRSGETGSWLGQEHQGRGIGTTMRRAICALAFDHLGFEEVRSGAFLDNPASLAVSRKVGYRPNGVDRLQRRPGELALNQKLVLTPEAFVRDGLEVDVTGVEALRAFLGLPEA